jgi:ribosomal protein S8
MEKRGMILVNEDTKLQGEHEKSVLKIHSDVFNSLGGFHQGLACALEKKGKVKIERGSQLFTVPAEVFAQLDPIEKIVIRRQADRGEVRIIEPAEDKNAAVFQASSIRAMSPMEQEVAKMLEDKGYIKIVEPTTETPKGGRHRKVNSGSKNTSVIEVSQHEVSFFERNYPIHHQVLLELIARGEARILEPAISKNAAVFQASSIRGMSRKEAKIARILEDTGYIQMVPTTGTHQLPTIPDSIKKQRKIVEVYPKVKV